jgi:hypothetical protein
MAPARELSYEQCSSYVYQQDPLLNLVNERLLEPAVPPKDERSRALFPRMETPPSPTLSDESLPDCPKGERKQDSSSAVSTLGFERDAQLQDIQQTSLKSKPLPRTRGKTISIYI